jgi:hypothetical protein
MFTCTVPGTVRLQMSYLVLLAEQVFQAIVPCVCRIVKTEVIVGKLLENPMGVLLWEPCLVTRSSQALASLGAFSSFEPLPRRLSTSSPLLPIHSDMGQHVKPLPVL